MLAAIGADTQPTSVSKPLWWTRTHTRASNRHHRQRHLNCYASRHDNSDSVFPPSRTPSPRLPKQPEGQGMAFAVFRQQCRQPPRSFRRRSPGYQPGSQRTGYDCLALQRLSLCLEFPPKHRSATGFGSLRNQRPTSTDSLCCHKPSDHAPGHQLASHHKNGAAGCQSRSRLKPSPISHKHLLKLVVTSPGTLRPLRL